MRCLDFLVGIDVNLNAVFYKTGMLSTSNLDPPMQNLWENPPLKCPGKLTWLTWDCISQQAATLKLDFIMILYDVSYTTRKTFKVTAGLSEREQL